MIDYRSPVAEILFALRHGAEVGRLDAWDDDLAREVVTQAGRFVDAEIAPLDPVSDRDGAVLENGRVRMPAGFPQAYARFCEAGWPGIVAPEAHGGQGLPHVLGSAVSEMLSGACLAYQMVLSLGQAAIRTIATHGTDAQKDAYLPRLASGEWLATMCMSEPQAGSDLSQTKAMAVPADDGSWRLSGSKVFASGGDQDMTDNIVHLVLARTPDMPSGVKGLALFIVPAVTADGRRNSIQVVRLEEKMGLHGSPTCQMAFDDAEAEIVGAPGEGLARMFTMMNYQRLEVALQGVGLAEVAGQRSRVHALERRQGRAPGSGEAADAIVRHGDVQRMLLEQIALTDGCRAMTYRVGVELERDPRSSLVAFLTPVCKGFCTEAGLRAADHAIQVHGGYGFCQEYRVEQIYRDGRITAIYEGTNGIQAMTLAGRMLRHGDGPAAFAADVRAAMAGASTATAEGLGRALEDWDAATALVAALDDPGMVAMDYLWLTGLVAFAAAWARLERAADAAPSPARTRAAAAFVRERMLPETALLLARVRSALERVDEEVFAAG